MQIYINNNKYQVSQKTKFNILQITQYLNISVPKFCYHNKLNVAGNCRMCLVEVEKAPKPIVACATPIMPNMSIFTDSPMAKKARENALEILLVNHPLDCPICDQGGECDLQENTKDFASDRNRNFYYNRRTVQDKNLGFTIKTIMTRCIHCTRCVRFIEEYADYNTLRALGRGSHMEIGTYVDKFIKTELSGNLVDLCPVGALTSKNYAFKARSWELKRTKTVDFTDNVGSSIVVYSRNKSSLNIKSKKRSNNLESEKIMRVLPFLNENINENWISDKTRFAFDGLYNNRLLSMRYQYSLLNDTKIKETIKNYNWYYFLNKIVKNNNFFNSRLLKKSSSNYLIN